jgi:PAS domain-containing protein
MQREVRLQPEPEPAEERAERLRFATVQAASGFVFREELRYWVADGSERIVDFTMHPIRDQSGSVRRRCWSANVIAEFQNFAARATTSRRVGRRTRTACVSSA